MPVMTAPMPRMTSPAMLAQVLDQLDGLASEAIPATMALLAAAQAKLAARAMVEAEAQTNGGSQAPERLSAAEAAHRLGVSTKYVYEHRAQLGGVTEGRRVVFPVKAIAKHIRRQEQRA
jgi:hypothetical protein